MKTNQELSRIDCTWNHVQLGTLSVAELTAVHNMHVADDKQIKKFRTKEQGVYRVHDILHDICHGNPLPAPTIEPETGLTVDVPPSQEVIEQVQAEETPTYAESQQATLEGVNIDGTTPDMGPVMFIWEVVETPKAEETIVEREHAGERRKPVKGVVKECRQLLKEGIDGENILSILQRKYMLEGGYDEKTARSSAQTILADTKKRMLIKLEADNTKAVEQMNAEADAATAQ